MADRAVFKGYALQGIDAKGRVALPAPMRLIVEGQKGERMLLLSDDDKHSMQARSSTAKTLPLARSAASMKCLSTPRAGSSCRRSCATRAR